MNNMLYIRFLKAYFILPHMDQYFKFDNFTLLSLFCGIVSLPVIRNEKGKAKWEKLFKKRHKSPQMQYHK